MEDYCSNCKTSKARAKVMMLGTGRKWWRRSESASRREPKSIKTLAGKGASAVYVVVRQISKTERTDSTKLRRAPQSGTS